MRPGQLVCYLTRTTRVLTTQLSDDLGGGDFSDILLSRRGSPAGPRRRRLRWLVPHRACRFESKKIGPINRMQNFNEEEPIWTQGY
jgi:hypothetical protein